MDRENSLLERAKSEEKNHNWKKAINTYEQILKTFLEKKNFTKTRIRLLYISWMW